MIYHLNSVLMGVLTFMVISVVSVNIDTHFRVSVEETLPMVIRGAIDVPQ